MAKYTVIGIMSGTSMDGVDLACCKFENINGKWNYKITAAQTTAYDEKWRVRLSQLYKQPVELYPKTDMFYGRYLGQLVKDFITKNALEVDFISSHGHTIFHQPEGGFTAQVGDGAALCAEVGLPVVSNFRNMDVALGGQGAPLVPVGDRLLFAEYDACLNLGGIANISFYKNEETQAFDICACNIVLNRVARWLGKKFDENGETARAAEADLTLLEELNSLTFFKKPVPKSLGREWINAEMWPLVKNHPNVSEPEKLATLVEHISTQIAEVINAQAPQKVLVTGGGAFNLFLMEKIKGKSRAEIVVPDETTINYKEALIFALLGVLRVRNEENVLKSVTGATRSSVSGALYGNFREKAV